MELSDKRCVPCRDGVPVMGAEEAGRLVSQVSGWTLEEETKGIRREFRFRNFAEAMRFARQVGEAAKAAPDQVSTVVAFLLLSGILLSLWMRPPDNR